MFGVNPASAVILKTIGIDVNEVARFRDVYFEDGQIVLHTRTGGGNRDDYAGSNQELQDNEFYIHDEDDDFDSTYANFYFRFPDEYAADLKALAESLDNHTPSEKWKLLFESIGKS